MPTPRFSVTDWLDVSVFGTREERCTANPGGLMAMSSLGAASHGSPTSDTHLI